MRGRNSPGVNDGNLEPRLLGAWSQYNVGQYTGFSGVEALAEGQYPFCGRTHIGAVSRLHRRRGPQWLSRGGMKSSRSRISCSAGHTAHHALSCSHWPFHPRAFCCLRRRRKMAAARSERRAGGSRPRPQARNAPTWSSMVTSTGCPSAQQRRQNFRSCVRLRCRCRSAASPSEVPISLFPSPIRSASLCSAIPVAGSKGPAVQSCNDPAQWPFARLAASAARLKPDLVIHTGDYLYREKRLPGGQCRLSGHAVRRQLADLGGGFLHARTAAPRRSAVGARARQSRGLPARGSRLDAPARNRALRHRRTLRRSHRALHRAARRDEAGGDGRRQCAGHQRRCECGYRPIAQSSRRWDSRRVRSGSYRTARCGVRSADPLGIPVGGNATLIEGAGNERHSEARGASAFRPHPRLRGHEL